MARGNTGRDLFLQVSGTVQPLQETLKVGKSALIEFSGDAAKQLEAVERSLRDLASGNSGQAAKQLTASYTSAFREIKRNAQDVLNTDTGTGAMMVLNANAARQAADAAEQRAAAVRVVAQAAREEAVAQGGSNAALTQYAAAAMVAEKEATDYAIALREQANTLSAVQGRMDSIIEPGKRIVQVSGQARAGMQQLSYQLGDVATQLAAGTPPTIVFAQQIGQVTQAIGLMTTKTTGFIGFIGGPWGMAFSSALVLLTPFVGKLFEGSEGSDKLKGSTLSLVDALSKQKIGTNEARKALDEYNDAQKRADKQTILSKQIALDRAEADLKAAQASRERIKAELERANSNPESGLAGSAASAALDRNEADIKRLEEARQNLRAEVGENIGKRIADAEFAITEFYKDQRQVLALQLKERRAGTAEIARQNALLDQREKRDLDKLRKRKSADDAADRADANGTITPAIVGNMLKQAFGGTITSTNGGKHVPGSFHYKNEAVDFVPAGGMGSTTKAQVRAMLEKQGIAIKELLGPGDKGHSDHFHVAFGKSRRGQDEIDRRSQTATDRAETAAEQEANRRKAFESQLDQAQSAYYQAVLALADTTEEREDVEFQRLRASTIQRDKEIEQQVAGGKLTAAEAEKLRALNQDTYELQKIVIERREEAKLVQEQQRRLDRRLAMDQDELALQQSLLGFQQDLATTAKERRRIALEMLELELAQRRAAAQRKIDSDDPDVRREGRRDKTRIDAEEPYLRGQVERSTEDPFDAYRRELAEATADTTSAIQSITVNGLEDLQDEIARTGVAILGLKGPWGNLVSSILADLAKIELKKGLLSIFGMIGIGGGVAKGASSKLAGVGAGMVPKFAGGGKITGPGSGTSDSILAWLSNGESVVNAKATAEWWPVIDAMNKGTLPKFATGGIVSPIATMPRIPSIRAAANDLVPRRQEQMQLDARVRVEASPLLMATVEETSMRVVGSAAEPIMAGAEARTRRGLSRPTLPGGFS